MKEITEFVKELILFVLIWKTLIYLCPQKWIRQYGKTLMGIYLTILCLNRFLDVVCVDIDAINREEMENSYYDWDYMTSLFTYDEEVKTKFDNVDIERKDVEKTQEKQGLCEISPEVGNTIKVPQFSAKNEISTIDVENIQSIKGE